MRAPARLAAGAALAALWPGAVAAQADDFPSEPPPPLEPADVRLPEVARDTLSNGLELVVVEHREQPVVSVRLYLEGAGTAADPAGMEGLAGLTASLVDKGTPSRDAETIAREIEGMGASLSAGASDEFASVGATTLREHLPRVLEVMSDVVRNPTFPEEEFGTQRQRTLSGLRVQLSQPGALASRRFRALVYGEHPYGRAPTPGSVEGIAPEDVASFHARRWSPARGLLIFAGAVDPEEARQAAERWFGEWSATEPERAARSSPPGPGPTHIHLVHRPGSVQSNLWVGHLGVRAGHRDSHALEVMNRILGGGANARLFMVLREEKGWTYGAYSRLTQPREPGIFVATAEVRTAVTDSALAELLRQVRRIREEPVGAEELRDAKQYLTGSFPMGLETPAQVASSVADALLRGVGLEHLERYRSRVAAVEAEDVARVARRHLRPEGAVVVVVGDATRILDGLRAIAPVTVTDVEGREVPAEELGVTRSDVVLSAERIRTGTFTYGIFLQGNRLGEYTLDVRRAAEGLYEAEEAVRAAVVEQHATLTFASDLAPARVRQEARQGPLGTALDLTYAEGRVSGTARLPVLAGEAGPQAGPPEVEEVVVDTTVTPGTVDANMAVLALLAAPLGELDRLRLPAFAPRTGLTQVTATVEAQEEVEVPAGTFPAHRVRLETAEGAFTLWVSRDAPRVLLRQAFAGQPITLELELLPEED